MNKPTDSTQLQLEREIVAILEAGIEDTRIPDAIATYADKRASKPVTVKDAAALEAQLGIPVRITKRYGMTQVAWALGTGQNPWLDERTLLIAHGDTNIRWSNELREKNPAYFEARDVRNAQRRKLLLEHHGLRGAIGTDVPEIIDESVVYRAARAIIAMRAAQTELAKLTEFGEPLNVANVDVEKLTRVR